jgi:hypothetical protein
MPSVEYKSVTPATPEELYAWHARPGAFERLMPPWQKLRIIERTGGVEDGGTLTFSIQQGPLHKRWVAKHTACEPGRMFRDEQVAGPFAKWAHTHRFIPGDAGESLLIDQIDYELPLGVLGRAAGARLARRQLDRMFHFRHQRTRDDLLRHAEFKDRPRLRIAITGASGLVGPQLKAFLTTGGHEVWQLVRRGADASKSEIAWDPAARRIDAAALEGFDAVIHLSGENLATGRWTAERKRRFRDSRVQSTELLSRTLAGLRLPPRVLVSASAIGFYGERGDLTVTESSPPGQGFLPDLCEAWEHANASASAAGIRVANLRIGVVIAAQGGALPKMLGPFKLGAGGVIGNGRQQISWISLDDVIGAAHACLFRDTLAGPVNAVGPDPVTNRVLTKTLGHVLHRPTIAPLPASVVNLLFGEMGRTLLLGSTRVLPKKLEAAGFHFAHPTLEDALRAELGR